MSQSLKKRGPLKSRDQEQDSKYTVLTREECGFSCTKLCYKFIVHFSWLATKFTDTFPGLEIDCIAHNFLAMTTLLIENGCPRQRYGFSLELIIRQVCNTCTHFS